ncbi:MAG: glycosyltransferase [Terriglobales bacterium]
MNTPAILHVEVGGSYGGSLRALELYLRHCDRRRMQHDLLLYYPTPGMERLRPLVRRLSVLAEAVPCGRGQDLRKLLLTPKLVRHFRASGCALIHCNNSFPYQAPTVLAARQAGLPLAAHVRNPLRGTAATRWLARQACLLVVLHEVQAEQLRGWELGVPVACCPDGVELAPKAADPDRATKFRRQWLEPGGVLVGALGRLTPQKGFADLIAAAAAVLPSHPGVRVAIFGEGEERVRLQALIAAHGLSGRVWLAGFEPDTASVLAALDLLVCSSHWEGLPLSVLEGMLAGVPVVATARALAGDPRLYAYLAAPPSAPEPGALAQAMRRALGTWADHAPRSEEARRWVAQEFAPATAAARLDELFEPLTRSGAREQAFYESAYQQPGWRRPTADAAATPGARFDKMWYQVAQAEVLPRLALRDRRVLEIGAGYGALASYLNARGAHYVGLDLAASALRQFPRSLTRCAPVRADACRLPFPDAGFDVVLCMEVFEHIPDRRRLLAEIRRVAAPGAAIVLSTPNYANFFLPLKLLAGWGWRRAAEYVHLQPVDHTQFAFRLRPLLSEYGQIVEQRAIRLHPPLFERLDYRYGPGRGLAWINDWIFAWERGHAARSPWRHCGLHTCFLLRAREARPC